MTDTLKTLEELAEAIHFAVAEKDKEIERLKKVAECARRFITSRSVFLAIVPAPEGWSEANSNFNFNKWAEKYGEASAEMESDIRGLADALDELKGGKYE